MNIVANSAAITVKVFAALSDSGCLNAGIPFEIASIPVSAAQPFENAANSRNHVKGWG